MRSRRLTLIASLGSLLVQSATGCMTITSLDPATGVSQERTAQTPVPADTTSSESKEVSQSQPVQPEYNGIVKTVDTVAEQITVLIQSKDNGSGSGAIVAKDGNNYYVLTAAHVVQNPDSYILTAPDGRQYQLNSSQTKILEGVDLAIAQFTSTQTYSVAKLGNYHFKDRLWVFVSGFPKSAPRKLTAGKIWQQEAVDFAAKDTYSLSNGYGLVYNSPSFSGMSGGPVLDSRGYVVGINAASENELEITDAGKTVEINLGLSLGVPIGTFIALLEKTQVKSQWLTIDTNAPSNLSKSEIKTIENNLLTIKVPNESASAVDWLNYGNQQWRFGRYEEAVRALEKSTSLKSDFYQAHYARGLALWAAGRYREAANAFGKAIEIEPSFYQAWRWQGISLLMLNDNAKALAVYDRAIQLAPEEFAIHVERGDVLRRLNRLNEAKDAYSAALKLKASPFAYHSRGGIHADLENYQEAIADYNKAIELDPSHDAAYNDRGLVYKDLKQYEKAIADFNKSLALNPDEIHKVYYNRGLTYATAKDYQKALADFSRSIAIEPDYAKAYSDRGLIYNKLEQYQKALADFNKAIAIDPNFGDAYHNRGITYADLKQYQKAIADYEKAIALNPKDEDTYFNRGWAYSKLDQNQKALADFDRAIALNANYAEAYLGRAVIYINLKNKEKALANTEKAAQLFCQQGSSQCQSTQELVRELRGVQ